MVISISERAKVDLLAHPYEAFILNLYLDPCSRTRGERTKGMFLKALDFALLFIVNLTLVRVTPRLPRSRQS